MTHSKLNDIDPILAAGGWTIDPTMVDGAVRYVQRSLTTDELLEVLEFAMPWTQDGCEDYVKGWTS